MQKLAINLMQAELLPQQPLWTLSRVVLLWCLVAIAMVTWAVTSQIQLAKLTTQLTQVNHQQQENERYLAELEKKVSANKADPLLQEQLAIVKMLLVNKKSLHQQLTDVSSTYTSGFSKAMTELSQLHHQDISLEQVKIAQDQMLFSGLARKPDAVPAWLAGFENSTFLSGQSFSHFRLDETDAKVTKFTVSSSANLAQSGGE